MNTHHTVIIRGLHGQAIIRDAKDGTRFVGVCAMLPSRGDLMYSGCAYHIHVTPYRATVSIVAYDWQPSRIAQFICDTFDSYLRLRYGLRGPQTCYEIQPP